MAPTGHDANVARLGWIIQEDEQLLRFFNKELRRLAWNA